jgi:hypothetical protein
VGTREKFIPQQAAALDPLDLVVITVMREPPGAIELFREQHGAFKVRSASPKQPFSPEQGKALARLSLTESEEAWASAPLPDAASASALVERVLSEVFAADETAGIDLDHGSRRPIVEAQRKLEAIRALISPIIADIIGAAPTVDADGDFVLKLGSVEVFVSPVALPNMLPVVRVFTITNVGLTITPELGLFLARINFTLLFGRFALDTDHCAVWFSETLLGEAFGDDELRFTVAMVGQARVGRSDRPDVRRVYRGKHARGGPPSTDQARSTAPPGSSGLPLAWDGWVLRRRSSTTGGGFGSGLRQTRCGGRSSARGSSRGGGAGSATSVWTAGAWRRDRSLSVSCRHLCRITCASGSSWSAASDHR